MSLHEDLGLDPNVDRNSFTTEQAIKVFEKAVKDIKEGNATAEVLEKILDGAFDLLPVVISLI